MYSEHYELVKSYYCRKLWSIERVKKAVVKGWITKEEYKEITGNEYGE
ncbi:MAG: XkdX family protein [Lachnospiraceae bacterium]|nr:XkdX family protein [Lachnospiraceae bacterium]